MEDRVPTMDDLDLVSMSEAAEVLQIGLVTFYSKVRPFVPVVRIGKRVLMRRSDLAKWVREHTEIGGVQGA